MIKSSVFIQSFLTLLCCFLTWTCSGPPKPKLLAGPAIPNLRLTGGYDCSQFGFMKIRQQGKQVTGSYEGKRKNGDNGTFRGIIKGDLLLLNWVQPGRLESAILPVKGKGWLRIKNGGKILEGRWGHDENNENGGEWIAELSEFY